MTPVTFCVCPLLAACDRYRYELLGCKEYHRNCTDQKPGPKTGQKPGQIYFIIIRSVPVFRFSPLGRLS